MCPCVCPVFQRGGYTAVPCTETDIHSEHLKIKPLENMDWTDTWHSVHLASSPLLDSCFCKSWLFMIPPRIRPWHLEVKCWRDKLSLLDAQLGQGMEVYRDDVRLQLFGCIASRSPLHKCAGRFMLSFSDNGLRTSSKLSLQSFVCNTALCALSVWGLLTSRSVWGWLNSHWKCGLSD